MILMNVVEYLIGSESICNIPMQPYSTEICSFAVEFSEQLMKSPHTKAYTDLSALAFWCRKGSIQKFKLGFGNSSDRLGRGLCFHITPSNIPINFAFSYFFGLFAGNSNIVRLPSKTFPQVQFVCDILKDVIENYPEIKARTILVRYPADNRITAEFCKIADARLIWGGDETVASIKALPTKPRCIDISFADRYSICIINGQAILNSEDKIIARLANDFYNDTYLMDQNACSSPQLILWINDNEDARRRFWDAISTFAKTKYQLQSAVAIDKYTHMFEDILDLEILSSVKREGNLIYRIELKALSPNIHDLRGKGGYFYEYSLKSYDELAAIVTEKYQTVTQFGIEAETLRGFVIKNRLRGIDRIVPVGKAMDLSVVWDGYDLIKMLSRIVAIE